MNNNSLSNFGEHFISEVRDESIYNLEKTINGKCKSLESIKIHNELKDFSETEKYEIIELLPTLVDTVLFHTPDMISSNDKIKLLYTSEDLIDTGIKAENDGLSGELFSEEGWISKYSNYPTLIY